MKRIYVKPLTEELEGQGFVLLAGSSKTSANIGGGDGAPSGNIDNTTNPIPQPTRQIGDDFFEDDEY